MVDGNNLAAVRGANALLPQQYAIEEAFFLPFEFRHKRVWHWVMDIQDDLDSEQPWNDRRENQEIGHVVDVDHPVPPLEEER